MNKRDQEERDDIKALTRTLNGQFEENIMRAPASPHFAFLREPLQQAWLSGAWMAGEGSE